MTRSEGRGEKVKGTGRARSLRVEGAPCTHTNCVECAKTSPEPTGCPARSLLTRSPLIASRLLPSCNRNPCWTTITEVRLKASDLESRFNTRCQVSDSHLARTSAESQLAATLSEYEDRHIHAVIR